MSADWSPDTFLHLQGDVFTVHVIAPGDAEVAVPLTLTHVSEGTLSPGAPRERPFSLSFTGTDLRLPQGTYRLVHAGGETFEIFIVPLQPAADGAALYEAVFN